MHKRIAVALICGLMAGGMIFLPNNGLLLGMWAPFVPLLYAGLSEGVTSSFYAGLTAIVVAGTLGGDEAWISIALFVVLPVDMIIKHLLRHRKPEMGPVEWYPVLDVIAQLTTLSAALFMAISVIAGHEYTHGLRDVLKASFTLDLNTYDPEVAEIMRKMINEWSFFVYAVAGWFWVLLACGLAWVTNQFLARHHQALRPDISIVASALPNWFPLLLAASAILVLSPHENDVFNGKTLFLILLLPYFLCGMAIIHTVSHTWRSRLFWLSMIYIVLVFIFWTTSLVVMLGIYRHCSEILDKRKKIG